MRIEVLGPVQLRTEAGEPLEVPERKVRALLAALTVNRGEVVPADVLIDRVWGTDLPSNPSRVLQAKLAQLRSLLDRAAPDGRAALVREPGGYKLDHGIVGVDLVELREALDRARAIEDPAERAGALARARELWRGRPYGELTDELWLAAEVTTAEEARLQAVELEAAALLAAGDAEAALARLEPLLPAHPTRESLVAVAMHASYLARRQPDALRHYERLRSHLADELGIDPGEELQQLFQRILRQDPSLLPARPASPAQSVQSAESVRSVPSATAAAERGGPPASAGAADRAARGNLPRPEASLVGRARELDELATMLAEQRLVTLLGIGGVGKTRLAIAAAQQLRQRAERAGDRGESETWFVDLTVLGGADGEPVGADTVTRLVSVTLGLGGRGDAPGPAGEMLDRTARALDERTAVVVLDNCEHVVDAAAEFTSDLLRRTRKVRVLATSREPLSLAEEQRYPLAPLPVDDPTTGGSPAVELFAARARAVVPDLDLSEDDRQVVAELCRRLDGLPLAIELAAGRMNTLTPQGLLDRITQRLDLLARPGRGAPRRQQTLRAVLTWSWELLGDAERALLRRLAVHPVDWALDAIEAVLADPVPSGPETVLRCSQVLPTLAQLVDRSLVATVRTPDGVRYRLLETVAAFAVEQLAEAGERPAVAARHLAYYRELIQCAQSYFYGQHTRDWVCWVSQERAHLHHAREEALRNGDGANAVALAGSMFWFQWMTGRLEGLAGQLAAAAAAPGPRDAAHAQVATLAAAMAEQEELDQRCRNVARALAGFPDDEAGRRARMRVQWFAATPLLASAEHRQTGERLVAEAIDFLLADGDEAGAALVATQRDWFLLDYWDERPRGLPGGRDVQTILRAHGDAYGLTQLLGVLHLVAEIDGEVAAAERFADEALLLADDLGLEGEVAYWESIRAMNMLRRGDLDAAAEHVARARHLATEAGYECGITLIGAAEVVLARRRGEWERATQIIRGLPRSELVMLDRWVTRILGAGEVPAAAPTRAG